MDTFFRLGWSGTHNAIHSGKDTQMLKAMTQGLGACLVAASAPHKTAQLFNPTYRLPQRWGLCRRRGTVMDGTIQRLPFLDLQHHITRHRGHGPGQHGGLKHPPRNDTLERQTALQALASGQLARCNATATFQNAMPDLN